MSDVLIFELVPGRAVGPFRLGMRRAEVEAVCRELGLNNDGATGHSGLGVDFDGNDRAIRVEIRAFNGPARLTIGGEELDLHDEPLRALLAKHIALPEAWTECEEAGLAIFHWESSDDFVFSFLVHAPGHRLPAGPKPTHRAEAEERDPVPAVSRARPRR